MILDKIAKLSSGIITPNATIVFSAWILYHMTMNTLLVPEVQSYLVQSSPFGFQDNATITILALKGIA